MTAAETPAPRPPEIERARQVFRFLKAFAERNVPLHLRLSDQLWHLRLRGLPSYPTIEIEQVLAPGPKPEDEAENDTPLLRVRRPRLTDAPEPPASLRDWVLPGWQKPEGSRAVQPSRNVMRRGELVTERFSDDPARAAALKEWTEKWQRWAEAEKPARDAMRVFERLYELYARIARDGESVELLVGDGRLAWRTPSGDADHPVLLQRVDLTFDASVPEFRVTDADRPPELYGALLMAGEGLSAQQLNSMRLELEAAGFHPLGADDTSGFLLRLANSWARGRFDAEAQSGQPGPDPRVSRDAALFLRTRVSGFPAAFDRVLEKLETEADLPVSLSRLVGVEPAVETLPSLGEASPWSEPADVLLSKPANPEQIQIARALDTHKAVLVQGPPGTGKSHTIANLIGHLVAQGKRVLVTSHTTKALRVLRDQIVESVRPLCVSVLDQDLESRTQMEHSVRAILTRLTQSTPEVLRREGESLARKRDDLNEEIWRVDQQLREARAAEYEPIVLAGEAVAPADAARWVREQGEAHEWLPGPVEAGAPLPLSGEELRQLYETNGWLSAEEEHQIDGELPDPGTLPDERRFLELVKAAAAPVEGETAGFWEHEPKEADLTALDALSERIRGAARYLSELTPWQRALVAAGHAGAAERGLWDALGRLVSENHDRWQKSRAVLLDHPVSCTLPLPLEEAQREVVAILQHLGGGGSLGWLQLLLRSKWKAITEAARVGGSAPSSPAHFRALLAWLDLRAGRERLGGRWHRQAEPVGLPKMASLGADPEPALKELASQFPKLCSWWTTEWPEIEAAVQAAGFRWAAFREWHVARSNAASPFERDAGLLEGPLVACVTARAAAAHSLCAGRLLNEAETALAGHRGPLAGALRRSARERRPDAYAEAYAELQRVAGKLGLWKERRGLLVRLAKAAPGWGDALRERSGVHGGKVLPGDPAPAWRWRQLRQEIDRRASLDEVTLTQRLHARRDDLRSATASLIDRKAWLAQKERTKLPQQQALQGWADTTRKIGKGTGKRAPELKAQARRLLAEARDAVPVWIMPLARVAESFDPMTTRFDVVIVDEASQSDALGLLAWFLGDRVAVVGDHEQVSPLAVGQQVEAAKSLIAQHLVGIPNEHLYDGTTSIYDLARQSFGGTIALREHFRCVPDIIEFSNQLSYDFEIKPLRNPGSASVPHVVEYVVPGAQAGRRGKSNVGEARAVVALLKAATSMEDFAGKTFGAISLLGDEQAGLIQDLAVSVLGAVELEGRRFVAGNSAQFQGDERDVMFLSMVDSPADDRLRLSDRPATKQRYNVAASRARDQLWLVHSLDPGRDLQPSDLRRRLIEHVRDPGARRRERIKAHSRAESPFERAVIDRLLARGYSVEPQVWVGRYRIDMVVRGGGGEAALECDGDRYHGAEQIPADMARQAILERCHWRFLRVRGTRFFRDPDKTTEWICDELGRLGVTPDSSGTTHAEVLDTRASAFREEIVRRAWDVMREQGWLDGDGPDRRQADVPTGIEEGGEQV